jgi:hypothetical protein
MELLTGTVFADNILFEAHISLFSKEGNSPLLVREWKNDLVFAFRIIID